MTDQELKGVREIVAALKRIEWVDGRCPWCARRKEYGLHVCSCPRRLALRAGERLLGVGDQAPDGAVSELIARLREAAVGERDALSYSGGQPDPGTLLVEQAAGVLEAWNVGVEQGAT